MSQFGSTSRWMSLSTEFFCLNGRFAAPIPQAEGAHHAAGRRCRHLRIISRAAARLARDPIRTTSGLPAGSRQPPCRLPARSRTATEAKSPAIRSRHRAAVAHRVRARMARCSTRRPCAAVSWGRQARRGIGMDADAFSPGQESCRKARHRLTDLPPMDGRQASSGVAFSFGYFSLSHAREK